MSRARDIRGAARLFKDFREADPRRVKAVRIKLPKAAMLMGNVRAILYDTTHNGKVTLYKHDFAVGSRPYLAAGTGRNALLLYGGRYHVTDRGIVDLDSRGREIEHTRRKRTRI